MQNFGGENFDDSTSICQIRQTFPPSKFSAIQYVNLNTVPSYPCYNSYIATHSPSIITPVVVLLLPVVVDTITLMEKYPGVL